MACFRKSLGDSLVFWGHEGGFFGHFLRKFIGTGESFVGFGVFFGVR